MQSFLEEICRAAERGETVKLSSFGSFVVRSKSQRIGRNPKTGVEVPILPRRVMVFKPSNVLKARINGGSRGDGELSGEGARAADDKAPEAFRTISEVAEELGLPQHVLRFWETRFSQIKPLKRGGGRRYYRPDDVELLRAIRALLYEQGLTIKGVQKMLREQGASDRRAAKSRGARAALADPRRRPAPRRRPDARASCARRSRPARGGARYCEGARARRAGTALRFCALSLRSRPAIAAPSECSAARLAHLSGGQGVVGSNPATPTISPTVLTYI